MNFQLYTPVRNHLAYKKENKKVMQSPVGEVSKIKTAEQHHLIHGLVKDSKNRNLNLVPLYSKKKKA